jgi:hypothetical protein
VSVERDTFGVEVENEGSINLAQRVSVFPEAERDAPIYESEKELAAALVELRGRLTRAEDALRIIEAGVPGFDTGWQQAWQAAGAVAREALRVEPATPQPGKDAA